MRRVEDNDPQWGVLPDTWTAFKFGGGGTKYRTAAPTDMLAAFDRAETEINEDDGNPCAYAERCLTHARDSEKQRVESSLVPKYAKVLTDALHNSKAAYASGDAAKINGTWCLDSLRWYIHECTSRSSY
jgi:hypothetical protein